MCGTLVPLEKNLIISSDHVSNALILKLHSASQIKAENHGNKSSSFFKSFEQETLSGKCLPIQALP
jgi:hypothetical protein